jgi:8-oxo-dGTP diphosphatase
LCAKWVFKSQTFIFRHFVYVFSVKSNISNFFVGKIISCSVFVLGKKFRILAFNKFSIMKIRPAILIIEDEKILTMQYNYGGQDVYNLPGGNLELGEHLSDALAREMVEEMGIKVAVGELVMVGEVYFEEQNKQTFHFIFEGKITEGTPTLNPKETSAVAIKWLSINELDGVNLYPNVSKKLQLHLSLKLDNKYIGSIEQRWF